MPRGEQETLECEWQERYIDMKPQGQFTRGVLYCCNVLATFLNRFTCACPSIIYLIEVMHGEFRVTAW
ncbi:hypothetical protein SERLA73DRAFT_139872, partial [Serpula lacrymans var. lacrymans S7.3]